MYQLISKEWGLENGASVRLEHYVADSSEEALPPSAPVGSDCLFPDGSKAVRFFGGWVIIPGGGASAASLVADVTVTGQSQTVLTGCNQTVPKDFEVFGLTDLPADPTPDAPVTPSFLEGVSITCGESRAQIGEVTLRRVGQVADSLMLDGRVIRRIGICTLTGEESFVKMSEQYFENCYSFILTDGVIGAQTSLCSHFKNVPSSYSLSIGAVGYYCDNAKQKNRYFDSDIETLEGFKDWLRNEYEKGTPVTLWYVLETPVVEEAKSDFAAALAALRLSVGETAVSVTDNNEKAPLFKVTYQKSAEQELSDLRAKTEELEAAIAAIG